MIMRIKSVTFLLFISTLSLMLASCGNKSTDEIEKEYSSGVVLVQNLSYYEIKLLNGVSFYFTSYDEEDGLKGFTTEKDSIETCSSYGTGFFVSADGQIATNHHVVSNMVDDASITNHLSKAITEGKEAISTEYNETLQKYRVVERATDSALYDPEVSAEEYREYKALRDELADELDTYQTLYSALSQIKPEEASVIYHNEIGVAYNDTYVTSEKDFKSCIIRKSDKEHDLAIIQLKDKKTPADRKVFPITSDDPLEAYNFSEKMSRNFKDDKNSTVYMAGFNLGPSLALTDEGIKLQLSSGTVSQRTGDHILYTIPSLPGSSGSPVLNRKGEVVAVNAEGIPGADNFNRGIRVKHLHKILNEN